MSILDALVAESPADDASLQAISLCYRELQQCELNFFLILLISEGCQANTDPGQRGRVRYMSVCAHF